MTWTQRWSRSSKSEWALLHLPSHVRLPDRLPVTVTQVSEVCIHRTRLTASFGVCSMWWNPCNMGAGASK